MAKKTKIKTVELEAPVNGEFPEIIQHDGTLYEYFDNDLMHGYQPMVPAPEKKQPAVEWKGAKMDWNTYCQMIAFFKWTYKDTKGESQVRLAYNKNTLKWGIIVMPQKRSYSLSTEEIADHPDRDAAIALLREGYTVVGTAHHHCGAGAFQSGTDKNDEIKQDGLHLTFGKMDSPEIEHHARLTMGGKQYSTTLPYWVSAPTHQDELPGDLATKWSEYWLTHPADVVFPDEWKTRVIAYTPPVQVHTSSNPTGFWTSNNYSSSRGVLQQTLIEQNKETIAKFPELEVIIRILAHSTHSCTEIDHKIKALESMVTDAWRADHNKGEADEFIVRLPDRTALYKQSVGSVPVRTAPGTAVDRIGGPVDNNLVVHGQASDDGLGLYDSY
jgi:hypothetical protein